MMIPLFRELSARRSWSALDSPEPLVECRGERLDCPCVDRRECVELDPGQLASLPEELVEHAGGIMRKPLQERRVCRQPANQSLHVALRHAPLIAGAVPAWRRARATELSRLKSAFCEE